MNMQEFLDIIRSVKEEDTVAVSAESNLSELDITSLEMMMLICEVEQKHNVEFSVTELSEIQTVGELFLKITER